MIQRQQIQKYLHTDAPGLMTEVLCSDTPLVNGRAPWAEMCSAPKPGRLLPKFSCSVHGTVWLAFHTDLQLPWPLISRRTGYEKARQSWKMDSPSVSRSSHRMLLATAPAQSQRTTVEHLSSGITWTLCCSSYTDTNT